MTLERGKKGNRKSFFFMHLKYAQNDLLSASKGGFSDFLTNFSRGPEIFFVDSLISKLTNLSRNLYYLCKDYLIFDLSQTPPPISHPIRIPQSKTKYEGPKNCFSFIKIVGADQSSFRPFLFWQEFRTYFLMQDWQ